MTERDDATGLDHTWWRKYENRSGRWASPDPYRGSMSVGNPQSFNRYAYVQNDPVNFVDPTGLNLASPEYEIIRTYTWDWSPWNDSLFWRYMFWTPDIGGGGGGNTGGGGGGSHEAGHTPQNPARQIDQKKYDGCAKLLGKSPAPSKLATEAILWTSSQEGTNASLIAVTWLEESGFDFRPGPNPRKDGGFDVGPLQTSTTVFGKDRFVNSLSDDAGQVMGTFATKGVAFNGDPYLALRWGARALNDGAGIRGRPKDVSALADMAGIYRAGSSRTGPYRTRVNEFNAFQSGYDAFFNCLRK